MTAHGHGLRTSAYWLFTGLLAFALVSGGALDLMHAPEVMGSLARLGYPEYVATLLGAWKLAGALAIVAPRLGLLKEWAYAGIAFDLSGAAVSHLASGDGLAGAAPALVILAVAFGSWALRPASRLARPLPWSLGAHGARTSFAGALERRAA